MNRKIICIICPRSCEIDAEIAADGSVTVSGFGCQRGKRYAESECINPVRTVTSTVCVEGHAPLPVRTDKPVPKAKMFECMKAIAKVKALPPDLHMGDVILEDICGTGANLIAAAGRMRNGN
ncbi:MAG: DUF1667 domain-containing protein [Clostridia bacterium]|nr:DUF1667 domain-containing protein [Clostridia bacterium]